MDLGPLESLNWSALNWSAIVFAGIFVATQVIGLISGFRKQRRDRRNLARALLAEIKAAHAPVLRRDMDDYLKLARDVLDNAPDRVTVYSSSHVYHSNVDNLGMFPTHLVEKIVRMYTLAALLDQMLLDLRSERMERMPADYVDKMKNDIITYLKEVRMLVNETVPELEQLIT